jgi:hypothetical protein
MTTLIDNLDGKVPFTTLPRNFEEGDSSRSLLFPSVSGIHPVSLILLLSLHELVKLEGF